MAVDSAATDDTVAAVSDLRGVIHRRRMPRGDVAALTEHRQLGDKQAIVVRPVRVVAGRAVLAYRRVLPQERSAFLGMAARAGFVHARARPEQPDILRSVYVVARHADHLAFAHRHVTGAIQLLHLVPMTGGAGVQ